MKTGPDLIAEAKERIREVDPDDVRGMRERGDDPVLLDVREPNEWNLGRVPGSVHVPRGKLETDVEGRVPRERTVVVVCASGNRSALAADTMQQMGYGKVSSLRGGFRGWVDGGGDVEG